MEHIRYQHLIYAYLSVEKVLLKLYIQSSATNVQIRELRSTNGICSASIFSYRVQRLYVMLYPVPVRIDFCAVRSSHTHRTGHACCVMYHNSVFPIASKREQRCVRPLKKCIQRIIHKSVRLVQYLSPVNYH